LPKINDDGLILKIESAMRFNSSVFEVP